MKKTIFVSMLLLLLTAVCMAQTPDYTFNPNLSPIKYGVEFFTEEGHGSHRAVVEVKEPSRAVLAHLEWRRHDTDPDSKGVVVENAKGQVVNSASFNVTDMTGDVVFQADTPGKYYIYYMPFYPTHSYFIEKSEYFSPVSKADKGWLSNNALDGDTVDLSGFPKAEQIEIQSKDDFNSFYPMEVPASDEEIAQMTKNITTPYMVFAEDRLFQIRMKKNVPYKWYKSGEVTSFTGTAQPNEIYTFQIGVYALEDIEGLTVEASDFGSIK
ncbi:MAG: hypothetical protein IJS60_08705, partial [Abditibacteriota bacterium]|nr:hypothetical protein [Abditibacteriota bacterium]